MVERPQRKFSLVPKVMRPEVMRPAPAMTPMSDELIRAMAWRVRGEMWIEQSNLYDSNRDPLALHRVEMVFVWTLDGTKRPDFLIARASLLRQLLTKLRVGTEGWIENYNGARFFYERDWPVGEMMFMSSDREKDLRAHSILFNTY